MQFSEIGDDGLFTAAEFAAAVKPRGHLIFPPTTLVEVENTQNRAGGVVWDPAVLGEVAAAARERGIASYLDGARLLNAAVARGDDPAALAAPFDLVAIALSKGLGAPVGSVLAGSARDIAALVRFRRMLGGAMRQSGILAAAGSYALEHHVGRLAEDHANARVIGERLAASPHVRIDLDRLETNIVVFHLEDGAPDAAEVVRRAGEQGVLVLAFAERTVRAVTHLDVGTEACRRGAEVLAQAVEGPVRIRRGKRRSAEMAPVLRSSRTALVATLLCAAGLVATVLAVRYLAPVQARDVARVRQLPPPRRPELVRPAADDRLGRRSAALHGPGPFRPPPWPTRAAVSGSRWRSRCCCSRPVPPRRC